MNCCRVLALIAVLGLIAASTLALTSAASIVRTSEQAGGSAIVIPSYLSDGGGCGSTIVRSYRACYRSGYAQPRSDSSYGATRSYLESPGEERYPRASSSQSRRGQTLAANFDRASYAYDYRGPLYERRLIQSDDFVHENKVRSGFFTSKNTDVTTRSVRNEVIEKYIGATESLHGGSQNNRVAAQDVQESAASSYDGGFSFGKQRLFDESEYSSASSSGYGNYYYRPYYDPARQIYNWRY